MKLREDGESRPRELVGLNGAEEESRQGLQTDQHDGIKYFPLAESESIGQLTFKMDSSSMLSPCQGEESDAHRAAFAHFA